MSLKAQELQTGFFNTKVKHVLHSGISFSTQPGEIILLAGPNGVGKSVFLRTLMGISSPLGGNLTFDNVDLLNIQGSERQGIISLMLATPPQIELMSPLEITLTASPLSSFFQSYSKDEKQQALNELKYCGVGHLANVTFNNLSDGEKQKVMLARCLFQNAKVVLLDEPTAFLDYPSKIDFWTRIQNRAKEKGTTFIVCTHDLHIAKDRVNSVWLMNKNSFKIFSNPNEFQIDFVKA